MNNNTLEHPTRFVRSNPSGRTSASERLPGIYQVRLYVTDHRVGYTLVAAQSEEHARQLALQKPRVASWVERTSTEVDEVLSLRNSQD